MPATLGDLLIQIEGPLGTKSDAITTNQGGTINTGGVVSIGGGSSGGGVTIGTGSSGGSTPISTSGSSGSSSTGLLNSLVNWLVQPGSATGSFLLRLLLFILGLICVMGAIYLYKGSNPVLALPAKIAKGAVKAGKSALRAASQEAGEGAE